MTSTSLQRRIYRSRDEVFMGGVCAGIANHYELDALVVRILAVFAALLTAGLACVVYVILWIRLPLEPEQVVPYNVCPEQAESHMFGSVNYGDMLNSKKPHSIPLLVRLAIAVGLIVLFYAVAHGAMPFMPKTQWWHFWPLATLILGLCLIVIPIRSNYEKSWLALGIVITSFSASIFPMRVGIMSWATIGNAAFHLWFLVIAILLLCSWSLYKRQDTFLLIAAFCFVVFCVLELVFFAVPGAFETVLMQTPSGKTIEVVVSA